MAGDEGIERVTRSNKEWIAAGLHHLPSIDLGTRFTGEDIRERLEPVIGSPTRFQAWGALVHAAIKRGLVAPTGEFVKLASASRRATSVYRLA
jgi:hypothetical protein